MPDFDPFGGGSPSSNKPKKQFNISESQKKTITTILVIIIVIGIIYFIATKTIFNYTEIRVNIENTEGDKLDVGQISFRRSGRQDAETFNINETIKIKKGIYSYAILVPEYKTHRSENRSFKENNHTISEILEKNINLSIEGFNFTTTGDFFKGQKVEAEITLKNSSSSESYSLDMIDFINDAKDWDFYFVHTYTGEKIDETTTMVSPSIQQKYFLVFEIPQEETKGKKTITPKIKYLNIDNTFKKEINLIDSLEISVSCRNLNESFIFGEPTKNILCDVDNSKNDLTISDLTIAIDVNAEDPRNEDVISWFRLPSQQTIAPKRKETKIIELIVPSSNIYPGKVTGVLTFDSRYFIDGQKEIEFELNFKEPDISFETSLSQNKISIDYDQFTNSSEMKYTNLKLNNKNNFRITVKAIEVLSPGLIKDCNNLIYYDDSLVIGNVLQKSEKEVPLTISILENSETDTSSTKTRQCSLKVTIENPFRDDDFLEYITNFEITTKIIDPPSE